MATFRHRANSKALLQLRTAGSLPFRLQQLTLRLSVREKIPKLLLSSTWSTTTGCSLNKSTNNTKFFLAMYTWMTSRCWRNTAKLTLTTTSFLHSSTSTMMGQAMDMSFYASQALPISLNPTASTEPGCTGRIQMKATYGLRLTTPSMKPYQVPIQTATDVSRCVS